MSKLVNENKKTAYPRTLSPILRMYPRWLRVKSDSPSPVSEPIAEEGTTQAPIGLIRATVPTDPVPTVVNEAIEDVIEGVSLLKLAFDSSTSITKNSVKLRAFEMAENGCAK